MLSRRPWWDSVSQYPKGALSSSGTLLRNRPFEGRQPFYGVIDVPVTIRGLDDLECNGVASIPK